MENIHGKVIDKTGNGKNGTVTGMRQNIGYGGLKALEANGTNGYIDIGNTGQTIKTVELLVNIKGNNKLIDFDGGTHTLEVAAGNLSAGGWSSPTYYVNANASASSIGTGWRHIVVTTATGFAASNLDIGRVAATYGSENFVFMNIYSDEKSAAWVSSQYQKYAKIPTFLDDLKDANESVAAEGGAIGTQLSNTNWKFGDASARYKISRDETFGVGAKVIECTTAGVLYQGQRQGYGTWEFDYYKGNTANTFVFLTHASVIGGFGATGQNGYGFYDLNTEQLCMGAPVNGSGATPAVTATGYVTPQTWYRVKATRDYAGNWYWYLNGTLWTLGTGSWPVSNNTYGSSYMTMDLDAGDKIANFKFYNGVI